MTAAPFTPETAAAAAAKAQEVTPPTLDEMIHELRAAGVRVGDHQMLRLKGCPEGYRKTLLDAHSGRSRAAATKFFCLECVGFDREEVRACTDTICPLHPYRPFQ